MKNRSARLVCCLLIGSLSGCLNLDPKPDPARYYTLAPTDFVKSPSGRLEVEVSQLPYYAKTKRIALRKGPVEIIYFDFDRWTGPLDVMLAARIQERLESTLSGARSESWMIQIEVLACEGLSEGGVRFGADYRVFCDGEPMAAMSGRFLETQPWDRSVGPEALAESLGALVDAFSLQLAETLAASG